MILLTFKVIRGTTSEHTSKAPRTIVRFGDILRIYIQAKRITAHIWHRHYGELMKAPRPLRHFPREPISREQNHIK